MMEPGFRFRRSFNFHKPSSEIARCGESILRRTARNSENFWETKICGSNWVHGRCFAETIQGGTVVAWPCTLRKPAQSCVLSGISPISETPTGFHIASASRGLSQPAVPTLREWLALPDVREIFESAQVMSIDIFLGKILVFLRLQRTDASYGTTGKSHRENCLQQKLQRSQQESSKTAIVGGVCTIKCAF